MARTVRYRQCSPRSLGLVVKGLAIVGTAGAMALTGCGGGTAATLANGPVDGRYTGSVDVGGRVVPVTFTVAGNGANVNDFTLSPTSDLCSGGGAWAPGAGVLPQLSVGNDHTFHAHGDGQDQRLPVTLTGAGSVELVGHLDGHGFAQGVVRLQTTFCNLQGSWMASDAGATATSPHIIDGSYSGYSIVFHGDRVGRGQENHPGLTFTVTSDGRRVTGITAGVLNECAGRGDYIASRFADTDVDSTGLFTTTSGSGVKLVGHLDGDGFAVGDIISAHDAGRCGEDGSTWEARQESGSAAG